jgi:hypothetical protein
MEKEVADQAIIYYVVVSKLFTAKSNWFSLIIVIQDQYF